MSKTTVGESTATGSTVEVAILLQRVLTLLCGLALAIGPKMWSRL